MGTGNPDSKQDPGDCESRSPSPEGRRRPDLLSPDELHRRVASLADQVRQLADARGRAGAPSGTNGSRASSVASPAQPNATVALADRHGSATVPPPSPVREVEDSLVAAHRQPAAPATPPGETAGDPSRRLVAGVIAMAELTAVEILANAEREAAEIRARATRNDPSAGIAESLERQRESLAALAAQTDRLEAAIEAVRAQIRALDATRLSLLKSLATREQPSSRERE